MRPGRRVAGRLLERPDLRASEDALRRWLGAAAQVRPSSSGGSVIITADPQAPAVQALIRIDPGSQADLVAANGAVIGPLFSRLPTFQTMGWRRLLSNAFIQTSCALVRRADLGTQPFDPTLRIAEDRDLWIRLASNGVTALLQNVLVRKAELPTSFMSTHTMLIAVDTKRMVDYHVSAMRDYMSWRERRLIYGSLHSSIGKGFAAHAGHYLRGVRHLLLAIGMGYNMTDNVRFLILSNPAVRTLRHRLGLRRANAG